MLYCSLVYSAGHAMTRLIQSPFFSPCLLRHHDSVTVKSQQKNMTCGWGIFAFFLSKLFYFCEEINSVAVIREVQSALQCFCNVHRKVLPTHLWFCVGCFHNTQMKKYLTIECYALIFLVD